MIDERAAGLRQGEDRRALAAAAPSPARPQPAGVGDRRVARLGARRRARSRPGVHAPRSGAVPSADEAADPVRLASRSASTSAARRSSVIGATVALASVRSVAGGTGKTAVGVPAAAQTVWKRPRSGSMITRTGRMWPIGGMPPIDEAGQLVGLAGGRPADVALARHRREAGEIDPVVAGDEAEDRLEPAVLARGDEHQRLDDLAELGTDRRGRFRGRVGRLVEDRDVEVDALARGGVADPLDPSVVGGLGHGRV